MAASGDPQKRREALTAAALVALIGVPHGGLDHEVARLAFQPRFGRAWPLAFAGLYLGLGGAALLAWRHAPAAALTGFIALGAAHFGQEDARSAGPIAGGLWLETFVRGALPAAGPAVLHPAEAGAAFAALAPTLDRERAARTLGRLAPAAIALWAAAAGLVAFRRLAAKGDPAQRRAHLRAALEPFGLAALFVRAPPLLAFAAYFCGVHAPRHGRRVSRSLPHGPKTIWEFARRAAPLSLLAAAGVALAAARLFQTGRPLGRAVETALFVGLSMMAAPHMALEALSRPPRGRDAPPAPAPRRRPPRAPSVGLAMWR